MKIKVDQLFVWAIGIATVLILFNQWQMLQITGMLGGGHSPMTTGHASTSTITFLGGDGSLDDVDLSNVQSTAQAIATVFNLEGIDEDPIAFVPQGTPEYGEELGISFDDPVTALEFLAYELFPRIEQDIKQNDPETWDRYVSLASSPVGISCEFCCGIGPVGITKDGRSRCGCSHNPGILALTMYLMKNTDMNDAEVLREALKWKTIWFPKNMVGIAAELSGGDTSSLEAVPGMVGGC